MHFKEIVLKTILTTTYFHCILYLKLCLNWEDRLYVVNISDHLLITILKAIADKYGNNSVIFLTIKGKITQYTIGQYFYLWQSKDWFKQKKNVQLKQSKYCLTNM